MHNTAELTMVPLVTSEGSSTAVASKSVSLHLGERSDTSDNKDQQRLSLNQRQVLDVSVKDQECEMQLKGHTNLNSGPELWSHMLQICCGKDRMKDGERDRAAEQKSNVSTLWILKGIWTWGARLK